MIVPKPSRPGLYQATFKNGMSPRFAVWDGKEWKLSYTDAGAARRYCYGKSSDMYSREITKLDFLPEGTDFIVHAVQNNKLLLCAKSTGTSPSA